jgi:hypothetical protein
LIVFSQQTTDSSLSFNPDAAEFFSEPKNSDGQLGFNYDPSQFPRLSSSDKIYPYEDDPKVLENLNVKLPKVGERIRLMEK